MLMAHMEIASDCRRVWRAGDLLQTEFQGVTMLAYIDAGTAAAIAAMATGGAAGAKVAVQSMFAGRRSKKKQQQVEEMTTASTELVAEDRLQADGVAAA